VKVVCTFIGAQAQIDTEKTGGRNPLVEMAQSLDILGGKSEAERALDEMRGPKVADRMEDDPRLQTTRPVAADPDQGVEAANPAGSLEAMIQMFGGGAGKTAIPGIEQAAAESGGEVV
jgi:hypothetical protein